MFDDDVLGIGPSVQVASIAAVGVALVAYGAVRTTTAGLGGVTLLAVGLLIVGFVVLPGVT